MYRVRCPQRWLVKWCSGSADVLSLVGLKDPDYEELGDELEARRGAIELIAGAGRNE